MSQAVDWVAAGAIEYPCSAYISSKRDKDYIRVWRMEHPDGLE